jgi:hypothetical protein
MTRLAARRNAILIAAATTCLLLSAGPLTSAHSAAASQVELVPLAGSPALLVYGQVTGPDADGNETDVVEVRDQSGHTRSVGTVTGIPLVIHGLPWSLDGEFLTTITSSGASVRWWNLSSGAHGTTRLPRVKAPDDVSYDGSTPTGWLVTDKTFHEERLYEQVPSGALTRVGTVILNSAISVGPEGFVVSDWHVDPRVRYQRWSTPGVFRTLHTFHSDYLCSPVDQQNVACSLVPGLFTSSGEEDTPTRGVALLPLDGRRIRSTTTCTSGKTPKFGFSLGEGSVGLVSGHVVTRACGSLEFLSRAGRLTSPTSASVSPRDISDVFAYGAMIYTSPHGAAILSINASGHAARTLVQAPA